MMPDPHEHPRLATADRAVSRTLEAQRLAVGYGAQPIVNDVDLVIPSGKISVIVGANACGKSTLLKSLTRILSPAAGSVLLDGKSVHALPSKTLATQLGLLPQQPLAPDGIAVSDLVGRGRHPHQKLFRTWSRKDQDIVADAMHATGITELANRSIDELSGGQRQRVWIAMALAQRTDVLLLDEPTTFLDVTHQLEILDLLTDLNRTRGTTIAMVLHDINLAARYGEHIIAMKNGHVVATGPAAQVITEDLIQEVFALDSQVIADPVSGTPLVLPKGRYHVNT